MQLLKYHFHLIDIPPILPVMVFFIAGIIWHTYVTPIFILLSISFCITFFICKQHTLSKKLILYSIFALLGAYLHHKELQNYNDFHQFIKNKKMSASGIIIDVNEVVIQYKKITVITVALNSITIENHTQKNNKLLLLYSEKNNNILVGDVITFFDICCKKPSNESFQRYQIKEQIIATVFDKKPRYIINHRPSWSLRRWIWNQKQRLLKNLMHKFSPTTFRFFTSLFLGNRTCVKASLEETNEQFKIWGISHFLARSGLHLTIFIFIWQAIFCVIPLPLIIKQIILTFLCCIYFILTWTSAPFTRSFALFLFNKLCLLSKVPFHLFHYLTLVCFGFLLYCPLYLFFLDFQLSFALTFALAWFNQLFMQHNAK